MVGSDSEVSVDQELGAIAVLLARSTDRQEEEAVDAGRSDQGDWRATFLRHRTYSKLELRLSSIVLAAVVGGRLSLLCLSLQLNLMGVSFDYMT